MEMRCRHVGRSFLDIDAPADERLEHAVQALPDKAATQLFGTDSSCRCGFPMSPLRSINGVVDITHISLPFPKNFIPKKRILIEYMLFKSSKMLRTICYKNFTGYSGILP